jgi:LysM repeat protein
MTRETKLGLLVGMAVIIFICILVSEYLTQGRDESSPGIARSSDPELPADRSDEPRPGERDQHRPGRGDELTPTEHIPLPTPHTLGHHLQRLTQTDPAPDPPDVLVNTTDPDPPRDPAGADSQRNRSAANDPPRLATHHVRQGERLWDIAVKHYGDGNYYKVIYEANKDKMPSPDMVRAGVRLVIPKLNPAGDTAGPPPTTVQGVQIPHVDRSTFSARPTGQENVAEYTLKPGDTLGEVAQKFYGSVRHLDKLIELNQDRIDNPDYVRVGTVIRIPVTPD